MDWNEIESLKKGDLLKIVNQFTDSDGKEIAYASFEATRHGATYVALIVKNSVIFYEDGKKVVHDRSEIEMTFNVHVSLMDVKQAKAYKEIINGISKLTER